MSSPPCKMNTGTATLANSLAGIGSRPYQRAECTKSCDEWPVPTARDRVLSVLPSPYPPSTVRVLTSLLETFEVRSPAFGITTNISKVEVVNQLHKIW